MSIVTDENLKPIEEKVVSGERLSREDGLALFASEDLHGIGALADHVRRRKNDDRAWFVRNQHISYSNVCRSLCRFCAFGVGREDPRAFILKHDEIVERARRGVEQGVRQLHIVGSIHPELAFDWHVVLLHRLKREFPNVHLKAYTAVEIDEMARQTGRTVGDVLLELQRAGLDSMPGGGAEVLSEQLRTELCPHKASAAQWLDVMRTAHGLGIRSTATMLYGHIESPEDRTDHLLALRDLQDETGGFACFIPLAFQPERTALADQPPVGAVDSLKTIAVSRLLLDNFDHIKAYWIVLGVKLAQTALSFGADDLHGTVVEEQIAHDAGASSPQSLSVEDLKGLIAEAGFVPAEHNALYEEVAAASAPSRPAPSSTDGIASILDRAAAGDRLTDKDAERLFQSNDLPALGRAADAVRRRLHPDSIVTYVIDRNINYTNVCVSGCRFCAFYCKAGSPQAYVLDRETFAAKLRELIELGGRQVLLQGGMHPDLPLEWYEDLLNWITDEFGVHVHGFSPPEIVHLAHHSGLSIVNVIRRLHTAGLATIPGGGAEILSDRVREEISPNKCSADEWIEVMQSAHRIGMRTTATMMFGHVETTAERVEHLRRVRDLQDRTGGFTAFIPWTFQPSNTALGGRAEGGHSYLKTLAISRLFLDNVENIQASWVTQGHEICQVALLFGANDVGSTMIEENVVRAAGIEYRLTRADLERIIRQIGREPRQRDCYYRLVEPV